MTQPIGAIVLAAGFSSRFGSSKLLAPLKNETGVFEQTLKRIAEVFPQRLVVTRPEMVDALLPLAQNTTIISFEHAEQGMGASLAFAMGHVGDWAGCLICLGDMPFIEQSTYRLIASKLDESKIVIPTVDGKTGNPAAFGRKYFTQLAALDADTGGRTIIEQHSHAVVRLPVNDTGILQDIDTPAELERYRNL